MKVVPLIPSSVNFATRLSIPRHDETFRQWPRRRNASPKQAFEDEAVVDRWIVLPVAWIFATPRLCFRRFHRAEAWISRARSHFSSACGGMLACVACDFHPPATMRFFLESRTQRARSAWKRAACAARPIICSPRRDVSIALKPATVTGCDPEGTLSRVGGQVFVLRERTNREIIKPDASRSELAAPFERSALCSTSNDEVRVRRRSFSCCRSLAKWFDNGHSEVTKSLKYRSMHFCVCCIY